MIDPFELTRSLSSSPSLSSFFEEDFLIRVSTDDWMIKTRTNMGLITIYPTKFDTLVLKLPIDSINPTTERMLLSVVPHLDTFNGSLTISSDPDEEEVVLIYTVFIPTGYKDLEVYGQIIRKEIRQIKSRLEQMRDAIGDDEGPTQGDSNLFSADAFNKMMKDVLDKAKEQPKPDEEPNEEGKE